MLGCFKKLREALAATVKICKALDGFGGFRSALGSFDVNTVCPLRGSWINHVCMHFYVFF